MEEDFLKFGDKLVLYSDSAQGYLTTMGFSSPRLYIQECSKLHNSNVINIRSMVFQVVPKLSYGPMREYKRALKAKKQLDINREFRGANGPEIDANEEMLALERLKMIAKRIKQQKINNEKWIDQNFGERVKYGQPIQLRHADSEMYLQYSKRASDEDRSCNQVEIVREPSGARVTFFIQQRYKYRQDGESVVYNDHILLFNNKYNSYLFIRSDHVHCQVTLKEVPSLYRPPSPLRRENPDTLYKQHHVQASSNFTKFQVISYRQGIKKKLEARLIYSGDVIRLKHAETGGYLCYDDLSKNLPGNQVYVRIYKGLEEIDNLTTNSLFDIESHTDMKLETIQQSGEVLEWISRGSLSFSRCRFRHVNSGRLLNLTETYKTNNKWNKRSKRKQYITTLASNLASTEINKKIDAQKQIEIDNIGDPNFIPQNDKRIQKISQGISADQIFEIENTVPGTDLYVKNQSVIKVMNSQYNPRTGKEESLTISTSIKRLDGDDQGGQDDENEEGGAQQDQQADHTQSALLDISQIESTSQLDAMPSKRSGRSGHVHPQPPEEEEEKEEEPYVDESKFTPLSSDYSDTIVINQTKLIKVGSMDDVFIIEKVTNEEISSVLFIHSCVPQIKTFVNNLKFKPEELTSPYMQQFTEMLSELVLFMIITDEDDPFKADGQPIKQHQKFIREIKIIDLLIDIIIYPFEEVEGNKSVYQLENLTQKSPITRICQLIYRLLRHSVKDNSTNKFYVAQWISHFFHQSLNTQTTNDIQSEATINGIINNNKNLLDKQINSTVIRNIVESCAQGEKNDRFLVLLSSLCSCNDEAVGSNQDDVCDILLEDEEFAHLLIKVKKKGKQHVAIFEEDGLTEDNRPLVLDIDKMFTYFNEREDLRLYNYFENLANLISLMCLSRNYKGIKLLESLYPIDFTLDCFFNTKLQLALRSNLAKILIALHIDKDPLEPINLPNLTRVWQDISNPQLGLTKSKGVINVRLYKLKEFVLEFFGSMGGVQRSFANDLNNLTLQVLHILDKMIKLGFYQKEDEIVKIVNPIINLLDGSNDFTSKIEEDAFIDFQQNKLAEEAAGKKRSALDDKFKRDKDKRYKNCESNEVIFAIKKKIIKILSYIIDIQNDIRLTRFLVEFHKTDTALMNDPSIAGKELFYLQNTLKDQVNEDDQDIKQQCDEKVISWMKIAYQNKSVDMQTMSEKDLICILLDIILYQDIVMVNMAFTLLSRYFQQKRNIVNNATDVQLLQDEEEVAILKKCSELISDMKREAENSEFWMGCDDTESLKKAKKFIANLELLTELCIDNPERVIDIDDKKAKGDDDEDKQEEQQEDEEFLNVSSLLADWDNEDPKVCDDDEKNDIKNQRLLKNLRAVEVSTIIINQQALDSCENEGSYLRVLEKAYIFLIKFVKNNKNNQSELIDSLDLYLDDIEYGVHSWELICEIFRNSDKLITYNLVPIIKKAIKLIDDLSSETQKKTILLSFLNYFLSLNGDPIKQNQTLMANEVTSSVRKNTDHLFIGEAGLKQLHLYMLEMKHAYMEFMKDERLLQEIGIPPELCYTIEYIKLLAKCGEGKNSVTESIASDKLTLDDLIANLRMSDFCYPLKSALIQFMDTIYFDTEKDVSDDNIAKMHQVFLIICEDMKIFLQMQQRVKAQSSGQVGTQQKRTTIQIDDEQDLDCLEVDIFSNFDMLTAFGSFQIVQLMEKYIYDVVFLAITHYFSLRLPIKPNQQEVYKEFFSILQRSVSFAKKDSHFDNARMLFTTIKKIPQLKDLGGESLINKQLSNYIASVDAKKNQQRCGGDGVMAGIPSLSQAEKLNAYLKSVITSDDMLNEFEKEFDEIVIYIINIAKKTEIAFAGTNTLYVEDLIGSLIKVSDIDSDILPNLKIINLKVIRKVVELENKNCNDPALDWEAEDWEQFEDKVIAKQKILIDLGVVPLLCNLVAHENLLSLKEEAFMVAVACVIGGFLETQQQFFEYIRGDSNNAFIIAVKNMLEDAFEYMKSSQIKRNNDKLRLIQIEKKLQDLNNISSPTRTIKLEINKQKELLSACEDDIKQTEYDESENPAAYTTNNLTVRRSIQNSKVILRFLQLLCENHNPNLQDALREQCNFDGKVKQTSFDFPSYLSINLEFFQSMFNNQTFDVCNQLVDTLTESIQGPCKLNQRALVTSKIIDSSREYISGFEKKDEVLQLGFETDDDIDGIGEFKGKLVTMLTSLLEGEIDIEIIFRMSRSLDFLTMKQRMLTVFTRFAQKQLDPDGEDIEARDISVPKLDASLEKDSFSDNIAEAFEIYILIHSLADSSESASEHLLKSNFSADEWKASEFIRSHIGRIEINVKGNLQRVYFPISPVCYQISKTTRSHLMSTVNRESQANKVNDLIHSVPDLEDEMIHNDDLTRATIQITPQRLTALKDFSTYVGLAVNLIYLARAKRRYHYRDLDVEDWVIDTIEYLGYIQASSSFILIFFYAINKKSLVTKQKWREYTTENEKLFEENSAGILPNDERLEVEEMSLEMTHIILMLSGPEAPEFNLEDKKNFGNIFTKIEVQFYDIYFFIQDTVFQYYVLYFGISCLGYLSSDIYYSFHLLDVINRSVILQNVIKAIVDNLYTVSLTFMLMFVFIYIYTSITFFYIQDGMWDYGINAYDSDLVGENKCLTMLQCLITTIDQGLRNGGGIGDTTEPAHFNDDVEKYAVKLFHDATFQIVINITGLNIIFGIIVNSFAELRDIKAKNDLDMYNRCYICNIEKMVFEKSADGPNGGFSCHIEKDHNLWQYVYYIVYLKNKDSSDYTGVESYVVDQLDKDEIAWIPRNALCLQNVVTDSEDGGGDADNETSAILKTWQQRIYVCVKQMKEIQEKIARREKKENDEIQETQAKEIREEKEREKRMNDQNMLF